MDTNQARINRDGATAAKVWSKNLQQFLYGEVMRGDERSRVLRVRAASKVWLYYVQELDGAEWKTREIYDFSRNALAWWKGLPSRSSRPS